MKNTRESEFLVNSIIAHRGVYNLKKDSIPENSIEAFKNAIDNNYIIELDLHVLKDNNVVVFHDKNLFRMTGIHKDIKECTYDEIKNLKLKNTDNNIPLFRDVLELVDGKVPLLIELKHDVKVGRLEKETMKFLKNYKGEYAIMSFNPFTLLHLKKEYPNIIRGQLAYDLNDKKFNFIKKFLLKNMCFNFITKPDFIAYGIDSMPSKVVEKFRKKGLVIGWTVKNDKDLEKAKKYCDNCIFEDENKRD